MHGPTRHPDVESILISEDDIARRVNELGEQISLDYGDAIDAGEELLLVGLLRGAAIFMADLSRAIKKPVRMDYMTVSSYGNGAKSSGMVRISQDLTDDVAGKHVIIVEDVIDTGLTLKYITRNIASRGPLSVEIAALLRKRIEGQADISCKYLGFECGDEFLVGYGLDYGQRYRNFAEVCILKPEVYS